MGMRFRPLTHPTSISSPAPGTTAGRMPTLASSRPPWLAAARSTASARDSRKRCRPFELCQLYVAAASRGFGAAAALIDDAESRMRDEGVETAWLACAVGNERAARFYEKRGWRRTVMHEPDDSGGNVFEVWRYEKRLVTRR